MSLLVLLVAIRDGILADDQHRRRNLGKLFKLLEARLCRRFQAVARPLKSRFLMMYEPTFRRSLK